MNFLQLTNRLRQECGASGPDLTTVQGLTATSESARMANWVKQAWLDVQTTKEDWLFLQKPFSFTTTTNVGEYSANDIELTDFGSWKRDSFRSSLDTGYTSEQLMTFMEWPTFRNLYMYGTMRATYQRPVVVSITPERKIALGATPDSAYFINGEYYQAPVELSDDTDEPSIPARWHMIIVYRAMMYYGGYEAAPEVFQRGESEYRRLFSRLQIEQLPTVVSGAPLA